MRRDHGWSLVELLVVLTVLGLLAATLVPSLHGAMQSARLGACSSVMRDIHTALWCYAGSHENRLPPFAFSDYCGDLPLSGHWGGASQPNDPAAFGRRGVGSVNLWCLVGEGMLSPARLICPGADAEVRDGTASLFPSTFRQSTFCLRFPTSEDLFNESPDLARRAGPTLLGIYAQAAGGQRVRVGMEYQTVPLVRVDRRYRLIDTVACGDGAFEPLADVILSDVFWRQEWSADAAASPGLQGYPVRWTWCHGSRFNVLYGDGTVRTVQDNGTVQAAALHPGAEPLSDDGAHYASYAERVWQFFDAAR
jgi:prepilin-type N-terminal cleavage/methylation domain-containing protein/prepilin-type processing-associated H-X9-DG protein